MAWKCNNELADLVQFGLNKMFEMKMLYIIFNQHEIEYQECVYSIPLTLDGQKIYLVKNSGFNKYKKT